MSTLSSIVRGQIAELFGRFRPAAGLSGDELKGISAERHEFQTQVVYGLEELAHDRGAIVKHFRRVIHDLKNQPVWKPMPTAAEIVDSVRRGIEQGIERPMCAACEHMGGSPGVFLGSDGGPKLRGEVEFDLTRDWFCIGHHEVLAWLFNRQRRYEHGHTWPYPPPMCFVPKESWRNGALQSRYAEYVDGALQGDLVIYFRQYLETATGRPVLLEPVEAKTDLRLL